MFCVFSYFRSLVEQFEVQLQQYRQQIEELENHLTTQSSGNHITPQGKKTFLFFEKDVLISYHISLILVYIYRYTYIFLSIF